MNRGVHVSSSSSASTLDAPESLAAVLLRFVAIGGTGASVSGGHGAARANVESGVVAVVPSTLPHHRAIGGQGRAARGRLAAPVACHRAHRATSSAIRFAVGVGSAILIALVVARGGVRLTLEQRRGARQSLRARRSPALGTIPAAAATPASSSATASAPVSPARRRATAAVRPSSDEPAHEHQPYKSTQNSLHVAPLLAPVSHQGRPRAGASSAEAGQGVKAGPRSPTPPSPSTSSTRPSVRRR